MRLTYTCSRQSARRLAPQVANLRAAHHGGESPALRLTRNFCNRGLEQPTAAELTLLRFCLQPFVILVTGDADWPVGGAGVPPLS